MNAPKKHGSWKWILLFSLTGFIDLLQILIDLTGIGVALSEAAEPFIGGFLVILIELLGIRVFTRPKRLGSMLAAFGLGAISGGLAPFWILDIWYIRMDVRREEAEFEQNKAQEEALSNKIDQPLYGSDENGEGVRLPDRLNRPRQDQIEGPDGYDEDGNVPGSNENQPKRHQNFRPLINDGIRRPNGRK